MAQAVANGNKLRKAVGETFNLDTHRETTTKYINGIVYETVENVTAPGVDDHIDRLEFINTEEGRARNDGWYPGYSFGKGQTFSIYLKKGQIWKIGQSMYGISRSGYTSGFYNFTGAGLDYQTELGPVPVSVAVFYEKMLILGYVAGHSGHLPPRKYKSAIVWTFE